jgi:hypothetical protein
MPQPKCQDEWIVQAGGSLDDLSKILPELAVGKIRATILGQSLYLTAPSVARSSSEREAEWAAYNLLQLLSAAANLYGNPVPSLSFVAVNRGQTHIQPEGDACAPREHLTIDEIVKVAEEHQHIRDALLLYAAGDIEACFKAYESISYMIMNLGWTDYRRDIGTSEWLLLRGFVNEGEEDRFFATRYLFNREKPLHVSPFSPREAHEFISKVILNVVGYCVRNRTSA